MFLLAQTTANHASLNHNAPELSLEIAIQDVRMAMQDCGALGPEKAFEEQEWEGVEDTRGVDAFLAWARGPGNREIRRVALEGAEGAQEDYLMGLLRCVDLMDYTDVLQYSSRNMLPRTRMQDTMALSWANHQSHEQLKSRAARSQALRNGRNDCKNRLRVHLCSRLDGNRLLSVHWMIRWRIWSSRKEGHCLFALHCEALGWR